MEADQFRVGNVIYLEGGALKTSDGNTPPITIIGEVGESGYVEGKGTDVRMESIGFHQLTGPHVVFADYLNNCLRDVWRANRQTSPYAGKCRTGLGGYANGVEARFSFPTYIITDTFRGNSTEEQILIITDTGNNALREMNTKTKVVTTLIKSKDQLRFMQAITQDLVTGDLFVTRRYSVVRFSYETTTLILLAGSHSAGKRDGSFSDTLFQSPIGLVLLANEKLLVADSDNHVLRLLDLPSETTSSICTGKEGKVNEKFDLCELTRPSSLIVVGDRLYCGVPGGIRMVIGR